MGLSKFKILKNKLSEVSPACGSPGISFLSLSFAISEICKEIPEASSGSLHTERYNSSAFTHLKIFLNNAFSLPFLSTVFSSSSRVSVLSLVNLFICLLNYPLNWLLLLFRDLQITLPMLIFTFPSGPTLACAAL